MLQDDDDAGADASPVERTRRAAAALFAFSGVMFGAWASETPRMKSAHGLSAGAIGPALVAVTPGTILALPLIGRFGDARVASVATIAAALALAAVPHGSGALGLFAILLVLGCASGRRTSRRTTPAYGSSAGALSAPRPAPPRSPGCAGGSAGIALDRGGGLHHLCP